MDYNQDVLPANVLHWNYRGFTEFPLSRLSGEESEVTDIYLKENLISRVPKEICRLENLESLYLSGNDITELPKEISKLRCLKCLDVSGNRLRKLPDEVGEMRSLKFLILDENELTELPLRLSELRALRYLSVCDNQILWLPQRPVYNYHHCEFRFWRNLRLKTIPYSLWYHMFRDQQTRSLNIGCLNVQTDLPAANKKIRLKIAQGSREREIDINTPIQHDKIMGRNKIFPPSLYELARRKIYQILSDIAKRHTDHNEISSWRDYNYNNVRNLEQNFEEFNIDSNYDINGNNTVTPLNKISNSGKVRSYYVPSDILNEHFRFLPQFMKVELSNGPVSRCENALCKIPVFDFVFYEFCFGKIVLIDNMTDVILSAAFCSKTCADTWRIGKEVIPWSLIEDH
ncbi:leucine-rich repeat-containing protein 28-like isoform X1 [Ostrinia furnacalis]|uniref:leucine-rich repeat-containing protein 28-like isoform X1 n=1 Tax=Ostrinia furnacalis TaxID=93504 RepID=UPI0010398551|nr:leucine-rich repeat-containing protein 28-like isoform X1 [Ostrinia furnacalis]